MNMAIRESSQTDVSTVTKVEILDVGHLDPAWTYETRSAEIIYNVYERLVALDPTSPGGVAPGLTEAIPTQDNGGISKDGCVYRFKIRKGVRFHNSELLTPEDVRYSLLRLMITDREGGPSWMLIEPLLGRPSIRDGGLKPSVDFRDIEQTIMVEDDTVVFRLKRPFAPFLSVLATPATSIISKTWAVGLNEWSGGADDFLLHHDPPEDCSSMRNVTNGTGPFKIEYLDKKHKTVLARFDDYWRGPATVERVVILRADDVDTRIRHLREGTGDIVGIDRTHQDQVKRLVNIRVHDDLPTFTCDVLAFTFYLNPVANRFIGSGVRNEDGIPPDFFSDLHVRRAFCYAFDYDRYLTEALGATSKRIRGPIPEGLFGQNPSNPVYSLDLEMARAELQQAFNGEIWEHGFSLTLASKSGHVANRISAEILKENVESLGPKFHIEIVELGLQEWMHAIKERKLPIYPAGWLADYVDPHNFVQPIMSRFGNWGRAQGYYNPEAEQLIEEALHAPQYSGERRRIYHRLQEIAYEDAIDIFANQTVSWIPMQKSVRGWNHHPVAGPQAITDFYTLWKEPLDE